MDLIAIAVPFFILLILAEFLFGLARGRNTYRLNDTINSLSMGTLSSLSGLVVVGFSALIYEFIVARFQLSQLPADSTLVWVTTFVLYDLAYYWKHRLGHEVALFWGSHVSHHQSEDYNLGTALRQTSIDFHGFAFLIPFFIVGVPGEVLVATVSLNLIYQFWVHTQHVPKLGFIEWFMVTPSNHRVHHARNDQYVDKNYGGVFILWDRLFGTFQDELAEDPPVFGLRKPLNSWNPLWANTHVYWRLLVDFVRMPGLANKLRLLVKPPGWLPADQASSCTARRPVDLSAKYDPPVAGLTAAYLFAQFVVTVLVSLTLADLALSATRLELWFAAAYIVLSLFTLGYLLERRGAGTQLECVRLIAAIGLATGLPIGEPLAGIVLMTSLGSLVLLGVCAALGHSLFVAQVAAPIAAQETNGLVAAQKANADPAL
jgi:sterol desaturase/sphingolipid hydroxylase (fatty acid hydroxylase superfamily)